MARFKRLTLTVACTLLGCGDDATDLDTTGTTGAVDDTTTTDPTTTIQPSATSPATSISDTDPTGSSEETGITETGTGTDSDSDSDTEGPMCGDGLLDAGEDCDTSVFGNATCVTEGFDGGDIACNDDCTFNFDGCTTCGDGMLEGDETCEDGDVGDETCIDQGFQGGELGCGDDCTYDTSNCHNCGNGVVDAGEDCDMDDLADMGCGDLAMGFTGGVLACDENCGFDTTACTNLPRPGMGEVFITEIMQNPSSVGDPAGEWFEVYNPSPDTTYQLGGCTVEGNDSDNGFTIDVDLEIAPLSYIVLADDTGDPGFVADYSYPSGDFTMNNSSDEVEIICEGTSVDLVAYDDGATFPDPNGASMTLSQDFFNATDNDDGASWCEATSSYNGDLGTPGTTNDACPTVYPIDFCRLQFPEDIDDVEGANIDVFGRLFIAGLTDTSGMNDPAPEVVGAVGWGPDDTDPAVDGGWTWVEGIPNAGYGPASPSYEPNNDEYMATLVVPTPPGNYDFAFRFSGNGGGAWTYCDTQGGTVDGYNADDAGQIVSNPAPVANAYFSEYLEGNGNDKAVEIFNADVFTQDLDLCVVNRYTNGSMAVSGSVTLAGDLDPGEVYVLCHTSISDSTNCDQLSGVPNWNGNDAVELVCGSTTLDVIGQIGDDPITEWSGGAPLVGTEDEDLRRDCSVTTGDSNGADAFDPSIEWNTFDLDDLSDLGTYNCAG